jgi:hypothetical protein
MPSPSPPLSPGARPKAVSGPLPCLLVEADQVLYCSTDIELDQSLSNQLEEDAVSPCLGSVARARERVEQAAQGKPTQDKQAIYH